MKRLNRLDYIVINQHRKPKVAFSVFGAFLGNVCVFEGDVRLCQHYRKEYNPNLVVRGIR